jgi:hypothetical protein
MKIVISSGHSADVRGATGYIDEVDEARRVVERVAEFLESMGVDVVVFHDNTSTTQDQNLETIVEFHNSQGPHDLDVSVHFNSSDEGETDRPIGTEVWYYSQDELADLVSAAIAAAGSLIDRGGKYSDSLYFLNNTTAPSILIEVCFVNSSTDCEAYEQNFSAICRAIAEAVTAGQLAGQPVAPPLPPVLEPSTVLEILRAAEKSELARYDWFDRGQAPLGYIAGMALGYSTVLRKLRRGDPAAVEMSLAATDDDETDALAWYASEFAELGMDNSQAGVDTLRHLFVLLTGLGMRESSGRHCEGRDVTADNVDSNTAEAGLFQMSWNMSSCSPQMQMLFDQYASATPLCALGVFAKDVSCSSEDWECYGSGDGFEYQERAKYCPQFAVETAALGLRKRRQHWGPINRKEAELTSEADALFLDVEDIIIGAIA